MTTSNSRPVLTPDPYSGEGSWDDWIDHFESVAEVNKWGGAAKILWLRVHLTGRAQTAFKQLSDEARAAYADCKQALRERFEPDSKKELYLAEFQTRSKRATEGWAAFAEDLKVLANKAFPQLQNAAKEQLALNHYLGQLTNQQISFNVRQKRPRTLDEAVSATLELESYLMPAGLQAAAVPPSQVVSRVHQSQDTMMEMLGKIMERLDKLESADNATPSSRRSFQQPRHSAATQRRENPTSRRENPTPKKPVVCHKCGKEGHFARGCAVRKSQPPGN